ncbi:MAG: SIP domain-containing protein [Pseudomonadota bacterium]
MLLEDVEHLNARHGDTLRLLAAYALGDWSARSGSVVAIEPDALRLTVSVGDEVRKSALRFPAPATCRNSAHVQLRELVAAARQQAPVSLPVTSLERELRTLATLPTYPATVSAADWLYPGMRRILFSGDFSSLIVPAPDAFMFVMVPEPGRGTLPPGFSMNQWRAWKGAGRPSGAYYTIRRSSAQTIEMWFVVHGDGPSVGWWARNAKPGDHVALWGPRSSFAPPPGTRRLLLIGDDTALPAIAAIMDQSALPKAVWLEVAGEQACQILPIDRTSDVNCVIREQPAGTDDTLLTLLSSEHLPSDNLYVFGAGEAGQFALLRRSMRERLQVSAGQLHLTGYWRRSSQLKGGGR